MYVAYINPLTIGFIIFENVYHIDILTPEHSLSAKESGDIERIIEQLEKVKIKKSPVSDNRSEERDSTNRFIINNTVLCFNGDFTEYWVNDDTKKAKISITEVTFSDGSKWRP